MLYVMLTLMLTSTAAGLTAVKTESTYYTPNRIATARENVARYEWAQKLRRRILEKGDPLRYYIGPEYTAADAYAAQSDEFIWLLQPTTRISRVAFPRDTLATCPLDVGRMDSGIVKE